MTARRRGNRGNTVGGGSAVRRSRLGAWLAAGIAAALVTTIAVVASGYDARDTPRVEPGVWVARDAGQYGRVNTDTGELDTVRKVVEPSSIVQSGDRSILLTNGNGRAWPIAAANPVDVGTESTEAEAETDSETAETPSSAVTAVNAPGDSATATGVGMPEGTRDVLVAGAYVAVRTEAGDVYVGSLSEAGTAADADVATIGERISGLRPLTASTEKSEDEDGADRAESAASAPAAALALTEKGVLAVYSIETDEVTRFDLARGLLAAPEDMPTIGAAEQLPGAAAESPQLTLVGTDWVLLDAEDGRLFRAGTDPVTLQLGATPLLQSSSTGATGRDVLIADQDGLVSVTKAGKTVRTAAEGVPARPTEVAGSRYAAWLGTGSGQLWRGSGDPIALQFDDGVREASELLPVFRTNGDRAVLSEQRTGMLWTVPDGTLIPLSQWNLAIPPQEVKGTVVVNDVPEQVAPTAVDDEFGARPGEPATLPVLLNDFDANSRDVLTIVPESLGESKLPAEFGTLQLLPDRQTLVVQPTPGAVGSASFTYRISDGVLESQAATVTVRIAADDENTPPEWCPVAGCQREWGVAEIVPGGTLVTPVLEGWVDPQGDVMTLANVAPVESSDPVRALVTADGSLAVRHTDPSAVASDIALRLTVRDSRGAEQDRELVLAVRPEALPVVTGTAATIAVGAPATLTPLDRVSGGSGSFTLVDVAPQSGAATATTHPVAGSVEITTAEPGISTFVMTVRDAVTGAETTGALRVTATPAGAGLALPPLRAYVRPLADATVEVLAAIPGNASRALAVVDATVVDGDLRSDVIEHSRVRVAGTTTDGAPGRIGSADITVAEGDATARGRLTVFEVPESSGSAVIAVADTATVRAGSVADIRVLENDVSAPGERLILHPEVTGSGASGELAFAAGGTLRYLAPNEPGTYRVGYAAYAASAPELSDNGEVIITVVAAGNNREPQPATLTARVAPGGATSVTVPRSGVDPDGDRVRLNGVAAAGDPRIAANIAASGTAIDVAVAPGTSPGTYALRYDATDDHGGIGAGTLNVVVTGEDAGPPVTITDQVRLTPGNSTVVQPLDNDVDPAGGKLSLEAVVPNVAGGEDSAEYRKLAAAIDDSELKQGRIQLTAGSDLGTVSYRYTVRSSASSSTAEGLIVVQTSERVGAQAPAVSDTIVSVRDRSDLAARGIDVLAGKVRWPAGDPATLKLSLWDKQSGDYAVKGNRITGSYDPAGDLVVFRVSGTDASGTDVTSYGLLIIPPIADLQLTLRPNLPPIEVKENGEVTTAIADLLDVGPDDTVQLRSGVFPTGREAASCEAVGGDAIRYTAGAGGPWTDVCRMDVRLEDQQAWTSLPVPVRVTPNEPIAELSPLTRTIAPGASETIQLADMVTWQGDRAGDPAKLRFSVSGGGSVFELASDGESATVSARADATSGVQETATVTVSGAGESSAQLTLRVGESPRDLPKAGSVALQCTVGASCGADVIGVPGEYDPFAGKSGGGLTLVSVDGGSCTVATFGVANERSVSVTWPDASGAGGVCTVGFSVRDAQGRTGSGTIEFDAQGLPAAPTSIAQTAFTDTTATFQVALGGRLAHPAVTGVQLSGAGNTQCTSSGPDAYTCVASGLRNGERHSFSARAINAVGESAPSPETPGWAYRSPAQPTVTVTSLKNPSNTDQATGGLRVAIAGSDDTREFLVSIGGVDKGAIPGPSGSSEYTGIPVGSTTVMVTPTTALELPPIGGGSATGATAEAAGRVIGAPKLESAAATSADGSQDAVVAVTGSGAHHDEAVTWKFAIAEGSAAPDCFARGSQNSPNFGGLKRGAVYTAAACASSEFGISTSATGPVQIGGTIPPPVVSYAISTSPVNGGGGLRYKQVGKPTISGMLDRAKLSYSTGNSLVLDPEVSGAITVQQCLNGACSEWVPVSWTGAPQPVDIKKTTPSTCIDLAQLPTPPELLAAQLRISSAAAGSATYALGPATGTDAKLTVTWVGDFAALAPATFDVCVIPVPTPTTPPPAPGGGAAPQLAPNAAPRPTELSRAAAARGPLNSYLFSSALPAPEES